jgi:hypothetical protein
MNPNLDDWYMNNFISSEDNKWYKNPPYLYKDDLLRII